MGRKFPCGHKHLEQYNTKVQYSNTFATEYICFTLWRRSHIAAVQQKLLNIKVSQTSFKMVNFVFKSALQACVALISFVQSLGNDIYRSH